MSDYNQITNFTAKDALISGNPAKVAKGADIDAELSAIATAITSKYDTADLDSNVSTFLTTPSSANLLAAVTDETGTGVLVFNTSPTLTTPTLTTPTVTNGTFTSPTLVTPVLGTPASGNLANCTAFPMASLTGAGTGVLTFLATPSSANLASALTDETGSGLVVFATSPTITTPTLAGATLTGTLAGSDNTVSRINLLDYGVVTNAIGSIGGGTQDIDLTLGNVVSATVDTSTTTFTFSNPTASDEHCGFVLYLTNGGSQTVNWPASVDWPAATAPTLTVSGVDRLVFSTIDGGTTWYGASTGLAFA